MKDLFKEVETHMKHALDRFHHELKHSRTGRASLSLLEGITVDYYGSQVPLDQVANLSVADASMIVAQPFDRPAELGDRARDHEVRSRAEPLFGRQGDPHPGAAADRGPPQGVSSRRLTISPSTRAPVSARRAAKATTSSRR